MTPGGWMVMILSVGSVLGLFAWCIGKVLSTPGETEKLRAIDTHTPDQDD
jgi:hypothetical protein